MCACIHTYTHIRRQGSNSKSVLLLGKGASQSQPQSLSNSPMAINVAWQVSKADSATALRNEEPHQPVRTQGSLLAGGQCIDSDDEAQQRSTHDKLQPSEDDATASLDEGSGDGGDAMGDADAAAFGEEAQQHSATRASQEP
jgi:hypothetical protein